MKFFKLSLLTLIFGNVLLSADLEDRNQASNLVHLVLHVGHVVSLPEYERYLLVLSVYLSECPYLDEHLMTSLDDFFTHGADLVDVLLVYLVPVVTLH